jgi:hypothetical protein
VLVFLRRGGLAFQVQQLLGDLLAQIVKPVQIFAGVADPGLGLAAALLVLGDAGGLLQKEPQILGPRLDEARDHTLFNDGVTAGAQTGTEEEILNVPTPAAGAVEEVVGLAVAADLALDSDLGVLGVFAPGTAIRVIEEEFDGCQTDRLAAGGTVEDDIGHRLAAQHLGGAFTHDPAHGVDDVRFAAAVRPHDPGQVARKEHRRGVHEGFETGKFDLLQPHRRKIQDPGLQGKTARPRD